MNYAPASITDICNLSLEEIGVQSISDIDDVGSTAAGYCRQAFWQAVREVARSHDWNCLTKRAVLPLLGSAVTGVVPPVTPPYWTPSTLYTATGAGTYVTYGTASYLCMITHTSSTNFINDLTAGDWAQTFMRSSVTSVQGNAGSNYEWNYAYGLPNDYILLTELNGVDVRWRRGVGSLYELYVTQVTNADQSISSVMSLYCNDATAVVKYVAMVEDPTIWDSLFVGCVAILLASKISTQLTSDGGKQSAALLTKYRISALPSARVQDGGESKERRYDPTKESKFLLSRYFGTNW